MFLRIKTVPTVAPSTAPPPSKSPSYKAGQSPSSSPSKTNQHHGLPVLGRMNPSNITPGTKVWVSDPKVLWRIGEVQSLASDLQNATVYVPDAPDEKIQTMAMTKLYAFDPSHIVDHDDIAQMNNMHEAPLLNVLRQRFEGDKIYTFTADILLSINPYKTIPLLYDVTGFMQQYQTPDTTRPPHLFTIAEKAYVGMKGIVPGSGTPQSIIVSGESGAGKTEASKYIMKYLATASKHAAQMEGHSTKTSTTSATSVHEKIEECVVLSNLILESFGNAKTSRNDNSSRFGKYIQIHYNAEGRMAGVSIRHFLLEKTRLVMPQVNERNYHIFYQLLAGLKTLGPAEEKRLKLVDDVWNYVYLTRGDCVDVDGVDDAQEFQQLRNCMDQLGMDKAAFQTPLFELLAAILHLGNMQFENSANDEITSPKFPEANRGVNLELVSSLLGVEPQDFARKMVTQTTVTGRGSILEMKLNADQAKNAMDAFCKYLYGEVFNHLIGRINGYAKEQTQAAQSQETRSRSTRPGSSPQPFIGILDIFGFEVMKKNSLEQLCINFTNETLQQQFNKHVFVLEQERYATEGIQFSSVEFQDNQQCLDLIQKPPTGLLPLLEEQMLLKRKTTDKQLLTIYHGAHLDKHPQYAKPRFECDEFTVRHYAGEVTYDINEFIAKNTDNLHDDLLDLMKHSRHPILQAIFGGSREQQQAPVKRSSIVSSSSSAPTSGKRAQGSSALTGTTTVSSSFRTQLTELMDVLWNTSPNYIKCIKPNNLKFPGGFSCELVRDQLVYSGVLEVVRIRQEGFPIRKRFDVFCELFWQLGIPKFSPKSTQNHREASEYIATQWLEVKNPSTTGTKKPFAMGRQEVFLRYGQVEKLEAFAAALRAEKAMILQARLHGWSARKKYLVLRRGIVKCQARWRTIAAKTKYQRIRKAARVIQANLRRYVIQKRYIQQRNAANVIFRSTLRYLTHKRYVRYASHKKAATRIQRNVWAYLRRTAAERKRKLQIRCAMAIQAWYRMSCTRSRFQAQRKACISIQAVYRAMKMRRDFLQRKKASIVLEAFVRQCIQRRKFKVLKQRVVKLQAVVRQWKRRKAFLSLRRIVVFVQSKRRQSKAIEQRLQRMRAMQTMQHAMKGWLLRCRFLRLRRSTLIIQYLIKSWLCKREYRQIKSAAKRIQGRWRRHHRTMQWRSELALLFRSASSIERATGLQIAATTSWRSHSKMEDSDRRVQKLRSNPQLYFNLRPKMFGYNTLFHHGAACGDFHVIKYMLDNSSSKQDLFYSTNGRGATGFHEACAHGQYEMAKFLLQYSKTVASKPATTKTPAAPENQQRLETIDDKTKAEDKPEQELPVGVIHQGYLKKRRETSRWMKRYVVLAINDAHQPQLEYYANDKPATLQAGSSKKIDLSAALFKKSMDVPFAFEIHSPKLLEGRNKEGRLYFASESELESQKWLANLRNVIPSSIESRVFAMHRGKNGKIEFVDFDVHKAFCSAVVKSSNQETPLHLVAKASINGPVTPPTNHPNGETASMCEVAVSASAISVTIDEEHHNNQRSTVVPSNVSVADEASAILSKTRTELEADFVKTALWLVENGADINATTARKETALKLALQCKNYLVAKFLLDRGALAYGFSEHEVEDVQRLKASLAKNAISSVGSLFNGALSRTASGRLGSFSAPFGKRRTSITTSSTGSDPAEPLPLLFLQKQPGKVRNSSYVSVFVELIGISNPHYLSRPRMIISVLDSQSNLVEMKQQVSIQPLVLPSSLLWAFTWHMQTPLENLPHGACIVFELTISPTLSSSAGSIAAAGAHDYVPVCWTYIQVDQRTANSMPLNTEMYKYPMDLTLKKLQRVDAFINGDVYISQGLK